MPRRSAQSYQLSPLHEKPPGPACSLQMITQCIFKEKKRKKYIYMPLKEFRTILKGDSCFRFMIITPRLCCSLLFHMEPNSRWEAPQAGSSLHTDLLIMCPGAWLLGLHVLYRTSLEHQTYRMSDVEVTGNFHSRGALQEKKDGSVFRNMKWHSEHRWDVLLISTVG